MKRWLIQLFCWHDFGIEDQGYVCRNGCEKVVPFSKRQVDWWSR